MHLFSKMGFTFFFFFSNNRSAKTSLTVNHKSLRSAMTMEHRQQFVVLNEFTLNRIHFIKHTHIYPLYTHVNAKTYSSEQKCTYFMTELQHIANHTLHFPRNNVHTATKIHFVMCKCVPSMFIPYIPMPNIFKPPCRCFVSYFGHHTCQQFNNYFFKLFK